MLRGSLLSHWRGEVANYQQSEGGGFACTRVLEFLSKAGQSSLAQQCESCEEIIINAGLKLCGVLRTSVDMLSHYATVSAFFPQSYLSKHRTYLYHHWLSQLSSNFTFEVCTEILACIKQTFGNESATVERVQQVVGAELQLQQIISDADHQVMKQYERLGNRGSLVIEDKRNAILSGSIDSKTILCSTVTAISNFAQRCLLMEHSISGAGERLWEMTGREGGWFLDEMVLLWTGISERCSLVQPSSLFEPVSQCIQTLSIIFTDLQELNLNFATIIVPEAMKAIAAEDSSVLAMLGQLNDLMTASPSHLIQELELHLRAKVMQMESYGDDATLLLWNLHSTFTSLLQSGSNDLLAGQMLLMGFNGLFDKLDSDFWTLVNQLQNIEIPQSWRKVDILKEARAMLTGVLNPGCKQILSDMFLVKRIQTMLEFFSLCQQTASALNDGGGYGICSEEILIGTVRRYSSEFVSRLLLGLPSLTLGLAACFLMQQLNLDVQKEIDQRDVGADSKVSIEELSRKTVDFTVKREQLSQLTPLLSAFDAAVREQTLKKQIENTIHSHKATMQRCQLQLSSHQWFHEDVLVESGGAAAFDPSSGRSSLINKLRVSTAALIVSPSITEAQERYKSLVTSVTQRLKWAAGANPSLLQVQEEFETAARSLTESLGHLINLANRVSNAANAVINHELLRACSADARTYDSSIVTLLEQCQEACALTQNINGLAVTPIEQTLMEQQPLGSDEKVNSAWISVVSIDISARIQEIQEELSQAGLKVVSARKALKVAECDVRAILQTHYRLMIHLRQLLKSIARLDGDYAGMANVYMDQYRIYSEQLRASLRALSSEDLSVQTAEHHCAQLATIQKATGPIYDDLISLAASMRENIGNDGNISDGQAVKQQIENTSTIRRDPKTGKALQERNRYAMSVWMRVKMKLEGRDPDSIRKASVSDQVDYIIKEATDVDNLALLYEGWTPWV